MRVIQRYDYKDLDEACCQVYGMTLAERFLMNQQAEDMSPACWADATKSAFNRFTSKLDLSAPDDIEEMLYAFFEFCEMPEKTDNWFFRCPTF